MIYNYGDFIEALLAAGFSMGGGNDEGIFAIINWGWQEQPPYDTPVAWHNEDPDTDPWEWRMRVLDERDDIAYAKLFFKKSGFITKQWYPYFLAARRGGITFDDAYQGGTISHFAKRIYDVVYANGIVPSQAIKQLAGFAKEDKSGFDRALTELQMKMYITVCGRQLKPNKTAWSSAMFCTTERFFGESVFNAAAKISADEARAAIKAQVIKLNPAAQDKKIAKLIAGS